MRKIIAKAGVFCLALMCFFGWFPEKAAEAANIPTAGASITLRNAAAGDLLCGYKLVDVIIDETGEIVDFVWEDGIGEAIAEANGGKALSAESFIVDLDQKEKHALLSEIRIKLDKIPELSMAQADDEGTVVWENASVGGYMIVPENTAEVYQMMFVFVSPIFDELSNEFYATGSEIDVKTVPIGIDKKVESITTGITHIIKYSATADLPTYASTAVDKYFGISDKCDSAIEIDYSSIHIFGYSSREDANDETGGMEFGTLTQCSIEGLYTSCEMLRGQSTVQSFALEFDYDKFPDGIAVIKIIYEAQIKDSYLIGNGGNLNVAEMEYTMNPFGVSADGEYDRMKSDEQLVYTYQLEIIKTVAGDETKRLSGAEFDLYRRAKEDETEPILTNADIPQLGAGDYVLVAHIGPTDQDGTASVNGLNLGTYYLVETQAPDNYQLPDEVVEIELSEEGGLDTEQGILTAVIENVEKKEDVSDPPVEEDPPKEKREEPSKENRIDPPAVETPKTADFKVIFFLVVGATLTAGTIILGIFKTENESGR